MGKMKYPTPPNQTAVLNRFAHKAPTEEQSERIFRLTGQFAFLAESVMGQTPPSREQSLALTALEEACAWAHKAILYGEVKG